MSGSYLHCVDESGALLSNQELNWSIENGGDVYEAVEQMYGMIWWLAGHDGALTPFGMAAYVEKARLNYEIGLSLAQLRAQVPTTLT